MIIEKNINLFDCEVDVIVHQANCFHTMGGGIAFAIAKKWPEVYAADKQTPSGDYKKLGTIGFVKIKEPINSIKYVINQYSQYTCGIGRHTNYEAFYSCLMQIRIRCENMKYDIKSVGFPHKIGCNLAGGDWRIVKTMIDVVFEDAPFDVVICKISSR